MEEYPPWRETLAEFSKGREKLDRALAGLTENQLDWALDPESWTIRQYVQHLADGLMIWAMFIKQALGDPGGEFKLQWYWAISQDEWAEIWAYARRGIGPALDLYQAVQASLVQLLEAIEDPQENSLQINLRPGESYQTTIQDAVLTQVEHLAGHLQDIERILQENS